MFYLKKKHFFDQNLKNIHFFVEKRYYEENTEQIIFFFSHYYLFDLVIFILKNTYRDLLFFINFFPFIYLTYSNHNFNFAGLGKFFIQPVTLTLTLIKKLDIELCDLSTNYIMPSNVLSNISKNNKIKTKKHYRYLNKIIKLSSSNQIYMY